MSPFTILFDIPKLKRYSREDVEANLNVYLLIHFLVGNKLTVNLAEYFNQNYKMDLYDMYLFTVQFYKKIPKNMRYTDSFKFNKNKKDKEDVLNIRKFYNCSSNVAEKYYLPLMSKESLKFLKQVYGKRGK